MTRLARPRLVAAAIVAGALALAWTIRFGTDDAYITFVYARSLVRGDGLTWFGAHVEGYTNFLWVLWSALGVWLGADPLRFAWAGSLAAMAGTLVATYRIAELRAGAVASACTIGLLATNFTFLAFGTSGLETMLQAALIAAAWWQVEQLRREEPSARRLALLSVTAALALATRLDSAVALAVLGAAGAHRLVRVGARARLWAAAIAPAAVLVGAWFAWKVVYYGGVLPNTYDAKVGWSVAEAVHGARYTGAFLHAYLLWPVLAAMAVIGAVRRRFPSGLPAALAAAWLVYVIAVGGDFMEFRFFVPALPPLFVVIAETITAPAPARVPSPAVRAVAVVALLAAVSSRHAATFVQAPDRSYDGVRALGTFYGTVPDGDWARLGRPLHAALAGTGATLACEGAGAIPYYADLPTVDQLGLNDRWIARHGVPAPADYPRPGHQRFASYEDLVARHVTFVIGTPTLVPRGALSAPRPPPGAGVWPELFLGAAARRIAAMTVVAAPVDDDHALLLWYLTPSPEITARVRAAGWEMRELVVPGAAAR